MVDDTNGKPDPMAEPSEREMELAEELAALGHALQTGVMYEMEKGDGHATEPKHLRVGINSALAFNGAVVRLLVEKGVITREEYAEAAVAAMREEVIKYEKLLSELYGANITLG